MGCKANQNIGIMRKFEKISYKWWGKLHWGWGVIYKKGVTQPDATNIMTKTIVFSKIIKVAFGMY